MAKPENHFDASRAELFEALGHPMRVKLLRALETRSMGFADLKKEVGIESSGHLQFHLGKLTGLVGTAPDGSYTLTDDGREALRVLSATTMGGSQGGARHLSLWNGRWTKPLIASLLIVVVILSGVAIYQEETGAMTIYRTTTVSVPVPCAGQVVWSSSSNSSEVPVLLMQPNTTAYACVTYQTYWMGNPGYNFTGGFGVPSGTYTFHPFGVSNESCTKGYGCYPVVSNSFEVNVVPTSIQMNVYTNYVTVIYTVRALANSTGYYSNSVPYMACSSMPIAVGHPAESVNSSDFGPIISPPSCGIFQPMYPVLVSISGMNATYLRP